MTDTDDRYDVVILGTGFTGSLLGAILARRGVRVALVDGDIHPKCAPGEMLPPDVITALRELDRRYDVPEIKTLTRYENCARLIGPNFGAHRRLDLSAHRDGGNAEVLRLRHGRAATAGPHLYRPAADGYLFHAAVRHGCAPWQGWPVGDIAVGDDEVVLTGARSGELRGRYLVDTTPAEDSPLVRALGLTVTPGPAAELWWAHLMGVTAPTVAADGDESEAATCDVFADGWLRLVPLGDDHRTHHRLHAVAMAVTGNGRAEPPEALFAELAGRTPAIKGRVADAVLVREWESMSPRYTVGQLSGPRWCLAGLAAAGLDPLYGADFRLLVTAVRELVPALLDDAGENPFEKADKAQRDLVRLENAFTAAAAETFGDEARWRLVTRAWLARTAAAAQDSGGADAVEAACHRLFAAAGAGGTADLTELLVAACREAASPEFTELDRHDFHITHG